MRFERISLKDYRGIRSIDFRPRPSGITVIEGENEAGKSSIAEALWLIFEQHDDSSGKLVSSLRPAGRDAATEIEVEVTTGEYRFTYFKRFHRSPRTELRVEAPKRERLAGREADARAKQILDETIDRQLWGALRVQQGASLDPIEAGKHESLLQALTVAAGQVMGGDRESSIYERAQQEYERYFTATGRERSGGDAPNAPKLRAARDAAMDEATRLSERIAQLEERANQAAGFEQELVVLAGELEAARGRAAELSAGETVRREQQAAVDALATELRVHDADLATAQAALDARRKSIEGIEPRRLELQKSTARLGALAGPLEEAVLARTRAAEEMERATEQATAASAARQRAEERLHLAQAEFTAETMAERLTRLEKHEPELAELDRWLAECRVDRGAVQRMGEAETRLEQVKARRDAEGAAIEVAAAEGLDFEVNEKPVRIEPGQVRRGTILGESTMNLPGGITITIRAGARAREAAAEAAEAETALGALLQQAGVDSVGAARGLLEERIGKEERRRGLQEQFRNDLRDLGSAQELREKLGRERARIAALRHSLGALDERITIDAAKAALDAAGKAAADAEARVRACQTAVTNAEGAVTRLERERDQLSERAATLGEDVGRREAELTEARAEHTDDALERACQELLALRTATHEALGEAATRLAELPDGSLALGEATAEVERLEAKIAQVSVESARIRGVLEDAGAEGLHARLQEAEQRLDAAHEELESFERRASAAKLLFETMRRHRDRARENYAQPLREKIDELGRVLFGPSFSVELSEDLQVVKRSQDGIDLPIDQLSVGVREQLSVLTRLACASLVSKQGGAPLVLDDILGWSDAERLKKFAKLLPLVAEDSQVLLFTCTPERFAGITPARVVAVPSGQVTERGTPGASPAARPSAPQGPARRVAEAPPQASFDLFGAPKEEQLSR